MHTWNLKVFIVKLPKKVSKKERKAIGWAPEFHAWNPSYLGGRDQEDGGSKPDQGNSS
jgi:hypothetical protein